MDTSEDTTEQEYLKEIDKALEVASSLLDMTDCEDDEDYDSIWEDRHHCGTCTTRFVMETIWPPLDRYFEYLKRLHQNNVRNFWYGYSGTFGMVKTITVNNNNSVSVYNYLMKEKIKKVVTK